MSEGEKETTTCAPGGLMRLKALATAVHCVIGWGFDKLAGFIVWLFHGPHEPEEGCFEKTRRWVRNVAVWSFATASLYLLTLWDPFGFATATHKASATLFYRVFAGPAFAERQYDGAGGGLVLDQFSVVLLVESDLDALKGPDGGRERWPTQYEVHADVLSVLDELGAKAVVVDIAFLDNRSDQDPSFDALYYQLEDMWEREEGETPVFLAMPLDAAGRFATPFSWLDRAGDEAGDYEWRPPDCALVSVPGARFTREGRQYALYQSDRSGQGPVWSAGLAAYAVAGGWNPKTGCTNFGQWPIWTGLEDPVGRTFARADPLMEIVWAARDFEFLADFQTYNNNGLVPCGETPDTIAERLLRALADNFLDVDDRASEMNLPSSLLQTCGPFATFSVQTLLSATSLGNAADKEEPEAFAELKEAVQDRVVFYGAAVTAVEDRVEPPTHVPLSATYFHAMAAANLLAYGDDYKRPGTSWGSIPAKDALLVCLIGLGILLRALAESIGEPARQELAARWENGGLSESETPASTWSLVAMAGLGTFTFIAGYLALAVLLSWYAWTVVGLAPINFVAAFTLELGRPYLLRLFGIKVIRRNA